MKKKIDFPANDKHTTQIVIDYTVQPFEYKKLGYSLITDKSSRVECTSFWGHWGGGGWRKTCPLREF